MQQTSNLTQEAQHTRGEPRTCVEQKARVQQTHVEQEAQGAQEARGLQHITEPHPSSHTQLTPSPHTQSQLHPQPHIVNVDLGERSYDVWVGHGVRDQLARLLPDGARKAVVITQAGIPWHVDSGLEQFTLNIPDGEEAKSLHHVERVCSEMSQQGVTRSDVIIAVGGGVVTDLAGFVAAVYHRGMRFVSVPTTLLGQVDAAIGGKTGVNLPQGKNLVGAFWQPHVVLCDTETLTTLPEREWRSGCGELAKYHFLGGDQFLDGKRLLCGEQFLDGGQLHNLPMVERIASAVRIKSDIVSSDELESGRRVVLNYGHTLAHALETAGRYDLRHGEAVAIGLVYAAELALRLKRIDQARVDKHRAVVADYGLSSQLPADSDDDELLSLFKRDKKNQDISGVTFVLDSSEGVTKVAGISERMLRDALAAIR